MRRTRGEPAPAAPRSEIERKVAALARRQHGVVARPQLLELGLSRTAIDRRVLHARLHRIHRGVYAVGHTRIGQHGRWMAAVLACWPDALLSHVSGGVLLALLDKDDHYPHVTAAGRGGRSRRAIHLHRPRALHPEDRASRDGIPVTSVSRTLVDLAGMLDERRLRRAFDQADRLYLLNLPALQRACERARGRRGIGVLRALVADYRPAARTRSELEDLFLDLCREYRLPHPAVNIRVTGYEVDAYWPDAKLVVELDGFEFHRTRAAFEQDRLRDAELKLAGIEVIRVTAAWIRRDPRSVAETVRRMLALRAPAGPS